MGTTAYFKYDANYGFKGKAVLNLGCGNTKFTAPNVVNLDAYPNCSPDVLHDLDSGTPLPFDDEYFDFILANHICEHLKDFWQVFNECARILKPNGKMEIWVPGSGGDGIFGFRDHVRQINACSFFGTFDNFRQGGNAWADAHSLGPANRLKFIQTKRALVDERWLRILPRRMQAWCSEHLRNVIVEQQYVFRKVTQEEFEVEVRKGSLDYTLSMS